MTAEGGVRARLWQRRARDAAVLALVVVACQPEDEPSESLPAASAGSESTVAGAAPSSGASAGAGEEPSGAGATSGGQPSEAGESSSAGQAGAKAVPPGVGGACGSSSEDDGECASCLRGNCCTQWESCEADEDCSACTSCLDQELDLGGCVVMNLCDIAPQATADMLLCGLDPCESECGFD
jgi:hypothetical protein